MVRSLLERRKTGRILDGIPLPLGIDRKNRRDEPGHIPESDSRDAWRWSSTHAPNTA
jgi:hypothetical protein